MFLGFYICKYKTWRITRDRGFLIYFHRLAIARGNKRLLQSCRASSWVSRKKRNTICSRVCTSGKVFHQIVIKPCQESRASATSSILGLEHSKVVKMMDSGEAYLQSLGLDRNSQVYILSQFVYKDTSSFLPPSLPFSHDFLPQSIFMQCLCEQYWGSHSREN